MEKTRIHIRNIDESALVKITNNAKKNRISRNNYIIAILTRHIHYPNENNIDKKITNIIDETYEVIKQNTLTIKKLFNGEKNEKWYRNKKYSQ